MYKIPHYFIITNLFVPLEVELLMGFISLDPPAPKRSRDKSGLAD